MKRSALFSCVALGALATGAGTLATDYGTARGLRVSADLDIELEITSFEFKIDDNPVGSPDMNATAASLSRRADVLDRVLAGEGSTPTLVRRTFAELHEDNESTRGEEVLSDEGAGALEGVTVELERDEDGEVSWKVVEGDASDELLEGQSLALDLDAFLPEEGVEQGETWDLDQAAVERGLALVLDRRLFDPAHASEESDAEGGRRGGGRVGLGRSLARLQWEGEVTLAEAETEREGVECARLHVKLESEGTLRDPSLKGRKKLFDPEPAAAAVEGTMRARLEGDLWFALEARRPLALELEGELSMDYHFEGERDGRHYSSKSAQSGPWTVNITVEEEDG